MPVTGGLIEFFAANHIPKDQQMPEFIMSQCPVSWEQEAMTSLGPVPEQYLHVRQPSTNYSSFTGMHQFVSDPFLGGLSMDSISSNQPPFNSGLFTESSVSTEPGNNNCISVQQENNLVSDYGNSMGKEDKLKVCGKLGGGFYQSKNLVVERNRRMRIKDKLFALRALVPKITKMDKVSIVGDAIEYIMELQKEVKNLEDELRDMEEEDGDKIRAQFEIPNSSVVGYKAGTIKRIKKENGGTRCLPLTEQYQESSSSNEMARQTEEQEVQVEVQSIGKNEFYVKLCCEHKRAGFSKLMEAMTSLGLKVIDANVTTCKGKVLNILKAETNDEEVQAHLLRDSLLKFTCNPIG